MLHYRDRSTGCELLPLWLLIFAALLYAAFQAGGWYRVKEIKQTIITNHRPANIYTIPQLDLVVYPFTNVKFNNKKDAEAFKAAQEKRKQLAKEVNSHGR